MVRKSEYKSLGLKENKLELEAVAILLGILRLDDFPPQAALERSTNHPELYPLSSSLIRELNPASTRLSPRMG